jgi:hypothetical protein
MPLTANRFGDLLVRPASPTVSQNARQTSWRG